MTGGDWDPLFARFANEHPYVLAAANAVLLLVVLCVQLMTTEAPVVLYQAF